MKNLAGCNEKIKIRNKKTFITGNQQIKIKN